MTRETVFALVIPPSSEVPAFERILFPPKPVPLKYFFLRRLHYPSDIKPPVSKHSKHSLSPKMNPELQQVHNVWRRISANSPIYAFLLSDVEIYHAEEGAFSAKLQVAPHHLNSKGTLHGVFSACVTDWAGGLAIASCGLDSTGVSTNINVTYLSTATIGDWLEIKGCANKVGKTLAFTTITISKHTSNGQTTIVAQGSHTKYLKSS